MAEHPSRQGLQLRRLLGVAVGGGLGFSVARALPVVPSILLSSLVLAGGAGLSRLPQDASGWWGLIGAACGSLIGSGCVLAAALGRIRARTTVIAGSHDLYFPPDDLRADADAIPGATFHVIPSELGHRAGNPHSSPTEQGHLHRITAGLLAHPNSS